MGKFTGKNMVFLWNGVQLPCLASVSTSESVDVAVAECAGATGKEKFAGLTDAKMDLNFMPGNTDIATINSVAPGTTEDFVFYPNGITSGYLQWSGDALVSQRSSSTQVNSVFAVTINLEVTGTFTLAAVP